MDDIVEGKQTLLMRQALERANTEQQSILLRALGNASLTEGEFVACLDIIRTSGALAEINSQIISYADQACASLDEAPAFWPQSTVGLLAAIARYGAKREA
jgi:geranylgeranyl pyrophosphate synthase